MAPALLLQQHIFQGDAQLIAVSMQTMQHAVEQTFLTKGDGNGLVRLSPPRWIESVWG